MQQTPEPVRRPPFDIPVPVQNLNHNHAFNFYVFFHYLPPIIAAKDGGVLMI
jgi:hypothetical protein